MIKFYLLIAAVVLALPGCALRVGHAEAVVDVPEVVVDVRPEHRSRVHLQRHWVRNGQRYCHYSDGRTYQRHYRYECPLYY